jgi:hypothetical protein
MKTWPTTRNSKSRLTYGIAFGKERHQQCSLVRRPAPDGLLPSAFMRTRVAAAKKGETESNFRYDLSWQDRCALSFESVVYTLLDDDSRGAV